MLEFYKTYGTVTKKLEQPEPGCWISAVAPTQEDIDFLTNKIGVLPEFIKSSLDEEESSHIDYDDDENQTLVIVDYPSAEEDDNLDENTLLYTTLPLGVVIMKGYVITISLYENLSIEDMANGRIKGMNTDMKTRFLLLLLLRISQRFLIYLRQIDRISSRTEQRLPVYEKQGADSDAGSEKSLVYFSTSLKTDEVTLNKIMRGKLIKLYEEDQDILEDVLIEIHQAIEMCNIYSNILSGTMDAFASVISNNLNIVMKILTVITIVMAIPNIIFSFYGMNVSGLPYPEWWFPTVIAAVCCIIATLIFKKKDMFH